MCVNIATRNDGLWQLRLSVVITYIPYIICRDNLETSYLCFTHLRFLLTKIEINAINIGLYS